jgi:hypothetical protein
MKNVRAIALSAMVFVAVGPAMGALTIWLQRPPTSLRTIVLLSYVFGGLPALIAGVAYGGVGIPGHGSPCPWYVRALLGAGAGLVGCLVFFLFVSAYDLLTIPERTIRDLEIRFLLRLVIAGIPAGTICALLTRARR